MKADFSSIGFESGVFFLLTINFFHFPSLTSYEKMINPDIFIHIYCARYSDTMQTENN